MAHLLKDCEDLLKRAWKEVQVKQVPNRKSRIEKLLSDIRKSLGDEAESSSAYEALHEILSQKADPYSGPFSAWKSCEQYYKAMLMLLTSGYEEYDILETGNAESYFRQAIPSYCLLSGEEPPVLEGHPSRKEEDNPASQAETPSLSPVSA